MRRWTIVLALMGREEVGYASGSNGLSVDDNVGEMMREPFPSLPLQIPGGVVQSGKWWSDCSSLWCINVLSAKGEIQT